WFGIQHDAERLVQPLKIRNQHLNATIGRHTPNFTYSFRKNSSTPEIVVVPVHAGDHCMLQSQSRNRFCDPPGFIPIDGERPAFWYRAETAAARANVAQQHECGSAVVPALSDIRT